MKSNQIKNFLILAVICVVGGCYKFEKNETSYKPFVDFSSVDLFVGQGVGDLNKVQLTCTPAGQKVTWSSLVPDVATVDQTGLVTAHTAGFTIITVASANDKTEVNVRVQNWVPLEDFTLDRTILVRPWMSLFQIISSLEPLNATETDIVWTSSNPEIASVTDNGWVLCTGKGIAIIYASIRTVAGKEIKRSVEIAVDPDLESIPNTLWSFPGYDASYDVNVATSGGTTIGYSSHQTQLNNAPTGSGPLMNLLNPDLTYFYQNRQHPATAGGNRVYPHWFILDLGQVESVYAFELHRRLNNGNGPRGFYFYSCDSDRIGDNVNTPRDNWNWVYHGEFVFLPGSDGYQRYLLEIPGRARYVMLYMDTKHQGANANCMFAWFGLYTAKAED
jgi:hypothetical protein